MAFEIIDWLSGQRISAIRLTQMLDNADWLRDATRARSILQSPLESRASNGSSILQAAYELRVRVLLDGYECYTATHTPADIYQPVYSSGHAVHASVPVSGEVLCSVEIRWQNTAAPGWTAFSTSGSYERETMIHDAESYFALLLDEDTHLTVRYAYKMEESGGSITGAWVKGLGVWSSRGAI